jgi:signal transduction histidine kinase
VWLLGAVSIRTRVLLFQLVVGLAVLGIFAAGLLAVHSFNQQRMRSSLAHRQLDALARLAIEADQYSEAVAKLLVTEGGDRLNVARSHSRLQTAFQELQRATEREYEFLRDREGSGDDRGLARNRRLFQLYSDLNARVTALLAMRSSGQSEVAIRVFYSGIDTGLDDAFERMIAKALADEFAEVETADREAEGIAETVRLSMTAAAGLVIVVVLLAGLRFYRSVDGPIRRLTAGALALGRGDLSHRVGSLGADEFGLFARRFDAMADQLAAQRDMLVVAQSDLEGQVTARTEELKLANRLLKQQDESRVRLLADISHELRTPLTIMRGEAEVTLLDEAADLRTHRRALGRVVEQVREMSGLVEDVMTVARAETDDIRFERHELNLGEVAAEAAREAEILGGAGQLPVRLDIRQAAIVTGDRRRVKQVLMILLDNASKYSPKGGEVSVRVEADADAGLVTVRNRSQSPIDRDLPRLFDRFYRGGDAASRASGSGLGLAIARWIVEKHGGSIALAREEADWVSVTVRFPVLVDAEAWLPEAVRSAAE